MSQINVDPAEVAKFEAMASRWWDPESEFKPLHDINPIRLQYIDERVNVAQLSVLDVGCGGGLLSESLARRGAQTLGIDMGEPQLKVATLHALAEEVTNVDYQKIAVEELSEQQPEKYDVITCMEMLEHVPNPQSIINAMFKLLKPGGHLFMSTINRSVKGYLMTVVGAEYILNMLPKGTHDYQKFIRPSELANFARKQGFNVLDVSGMSYQLFSKSFALSKDPSVNYLMHCQKNK